MLERHSDSALALRQARDNISLSLREITSRGMIDLRGIATDKKFAAAVKSVLQLDLPKQPRTSATWGDIKALWLSPDQWLVLCAADKADALTTALREALGAVHSLVVNVSDMRTVLRLEGEGVRETVMKGTSIDLTQGDYPPGSVRRMLFAGIAALLHVVDDDVIDLYVFRSYATHAWDFIAKSARKGTEVRIFPASRA